MVVMVDADLLLERASVFQADPVEPVELLSVLLRHPLIQFLRYADDGPPASVGPRSGPSSHGFATYDGWAVVQDRAPDEGGWSVVLPADSGLSISFVYGNAPVIAASDAAANAYADLDPSIARDRRFADALAVQVASQGLNADLYITERQYLKVAPPFVSRNVLVCGVSDAIAIVSLYLRSQDEFVVAEDFQFNRGLFFWMAARESLWAAWRWHAACCQYSQAIQDDDLMLLAGSLIQRVERSLQARDAIHVVLNQPQNNDLQNDALSNLDQVLVLLMGAVDVAARVAHRVLTLPGSERHAGWQNERWLHDVAGACPDLTEVLRVDRKAVHAITILRRLRNAVHGAALQGIASVRSGAPNESLVGLPVADQPEVLAAMDRLGGHDAWGVQQLLPRRIHIDPGILADRLLENVIPMLNELLLHTPVERLPHVRLTPQDSFPPVYASQAGLAGAFQPWARQSIRLQLGLDLS
jgi:hypothetical protein